MTLEQLRGMMQEWANDPHGEVFGILRANELVNIAYQDIVKKVDRSRHPWTVPPTASFLSVTMVTTQREYELEVDTLIGENIRPTKSKIRRVMEVRDSSGGGDYDTYPRVDIVPWETRNEATKGVYIFRGMGVSSGSMSWHLGTVLMPPPYTTLSVAHLLTLAPLEADPDVPQEVPAEFHEAIGYRAAMLGLMQEHEDPQEVALLYAEAISELEIGLSDGGRGRLESTRL